jgi:vancomycin permeability regulator SanA
MRYVISMVVAMVFALIATIFLSGRLADWLVSGMTFESPDDVANMHALIFMASNFVALIVGWIAGWVLASRFRY